MDEFGAQSLGKLKAVARQQGVKFDMKLAEEALRPDVGRQIYAPPPKEHRSLGRHSPEHGVPSRSDGHEQVQGP